MLVVVRADNRETGNPFPVAMQSVLLDKIFFKNVAFVFCLYCTHTHEK